VNKHPVSRYSPDAAVGSVRSTRTPVLACALVTLALALLPGCATTDGAKDGGAATAAGAAEPIPLQSFGRLWSSEAKLAKGDRLTSVYVREDTVFAYSKRGTVVAFDRASGTVLYIIDVPRGSDGRMRPPVVLKDHVVIPTLSNLEVYERTTGRKRTDPQTGQPDRGITLNFAIRSGGVGAGSTVFVGGDYAGNARVAAIDISRPYVPVAWELMVVGGGISSTPALLEESLYIGAENGTVIAVRADDREPIWALPDNVFRTHGPVVADMVADPDGVYVACTDSNLYAIQRNTGKIKWQYFAGRPLRTAPVATSDMVYQFVPQGGIAAFRKTEDFIPETKSMPVNRDPRWLLAGATQFLSQDETRAYLLLEDNTILAVDRATGEAQFQSKTRNLSLFDANTKPDGIIYGATPKGRVMAVQAVLKPGVVGEIVRDDRGAAPAGTAAAVAAAR
jgi:hypothetical protein